MDDKEKLKARLAMVVSGAADWLATAEDADVEEEVIDEVEEAHHHTREAFQLLDDREE